MRDFDYSGLASRTWDNEILSYIVKNHVRKKQDAFLTECPRLGSSSVEAALKRLVEEGLIQRIGAGRKTVYVRKEDSQYKTDRNKINFPERFRFDIEGMLRYNNRIKKWYIRVVQSWNRICANLLKNNDLVELPLSSTIICFEKATDSVVFLYSERPFSACFVPVSTFFE